MILPKLFFICTAQLQWNPDYMLFKHPRKNNVQNGTTYNRSSRSKVEYVCLNILKSNAFNIHIEIICKKKSKIREQRKWKRTFNFTFHLHSEKGSYRSMFFGTNSSFSARTFWIEKCLWFSWANSKLFTWFKTRSGSRDEGMLLETSTW